MVIPCMYDEAQHKILSGGEVLAWIKREAPAGEVERFFLYRHRIHGTFVIARWASDRAMGIFTDFMNLGYTLNITRAQADQFHQRMYAPLSAPEMARKINQGARDYKTDRTREDWEQKEEILQSAGA